MAKRYEFEVATPVTVTYPEDFSDELSELGRRLFDAPKKSGAYMQWGDGLATKARERKFYVIKSEKLRYVHLSRVVEPFGNIGLQFAQLALNVDGQLRGDKVIGEEGIDQSVREALFGSIGACTLRGMNFDFAYLDAVPSSKYESKTVFILRQLTEVDEIETMYPLDIVSAAVQQSVRAISPEIYSFGTTVEQGIPVAETTETNPDKIQNFKDLFTAQLLDPMVRVEAGDLEIKTVI